MSGRTDPDAGARALRLAARRRRILAWFIIAPLAIQLGVAVARLGRDGRVARGEALVALADSVADALRPSAGPSPADVSESAVSAARAMLEARGFPAAWHSMTPAGGGQTAIDVPPRVMDRLAILDRSFAARIAGRIVAVSPVKDGDDWDVQGILVVASRQPDPPRMPAAAVAGALLVLLATSAAAAFALRRPGPVASLAVLAPAVAFGIGLAFVDVPGAADHTGDHGLWSVVGVAAWAIVALTGLGLARIADRPLALGEALRAWAFLAPSFAHLLVFSIGPILFALWLSFHEWNLIEPARPFVGLANYRELAGDREFWHAMRNTAVYVLFVPAGMIVGLALALLANRRIPGVHLMRTVFFLPYVTSFVAISLVWRWMFQPDVGLFNNLLGRIGIDPLPWLGSPSSALPSLMLMSVWMYAGYMMVIFLAGLQNIPESLYESARIDGAGPWRRFLHITLPLLRPTLLFVLVTMMIFMFQVFTAVYVMTEGGPLHATDVVVYHVYRAAWEYLRMGYASAMAWVLFAVVFVITLIQFRFLGDRSARVPE